VTFLSTLQKLKFDPALLLLLALSCALFLSSLGAFRDFVRAESYFALGSRLMLSQGDWLSPHAPDEPVLNKPPLQYWLTAISYKTFGASYSAARLPSALAALGVLIAVYALGAKLYDRSAGQLAWGVLATGYLFYTFARTAMSDMLLTLWVTAALLCFILLLTDRLKERERLLAICGYACVALGILSKGPVAVILVAGPLALELLASRDLSMLKRLRIPLGALIILLISAPYFLLLYLKLGAGPLYSFFVGENLQRFTGEIYSYATRPVWYLPLALLSDFAPWSLLLPPALYFEWRGRGLEKQASRARRLMSFWLFFPLLFFSFSHFKLDYYLLPAMPAAAVIVGRFLAHAAESPRWARTYVYAFAALFALLMTVAPFASMRIAAALNLDAGFGWLIVVASICALAFVFYMILKGRPSGAAWALIISIWCVLVLHELTLLRALSRYQPVERLAEKISTDSRVYTSRGASDWTNTLAFHLPPEQKVTRLDSDEDGAKLKEIFEHEPRAVVLLKAEEFERLRSSGLSLRTLAEGETLGHGGLTLKDSRRPTLLRLKLAEAEMIRNER
jgi:4-amino-4-deoxy-L-arabinose transferase-like glycosyltransferase